MNLTETNVRERNQRDFSGIPVVKTLNFQCRGHRFILGQGTKVLHITEYGQEKMEPEIREYIASFMEFQNR